MQTRFRRGYGGAGSDKQRAAPLLEGAALRYGIRRFRLFPCLILFPARGCPPGLFLCPSGAPLAAHRLEEGDGGAVVAFDPLRRADKPIADRPLQVPPPVALGARVAQLEDHPLLSVLVAGVQPIRREPREGAEVFVPVFRAVDADVFHEFVLIKRRNPVTIAPYKIETGKSRNFFSKRQISKAVAIVK